MEIFCAYRERTISEVKHKLTQQGITGNEELIFITEYLLSHNFINETRYVDAYIHGKIHFKKWGKTKVRITLKGQQIDDSLVETILSEVDNDLYEKNLTSLLQKKWKSLKETDLFSKHNKCVRYALQKGYEYEKIIEKLKYIQK
jgi:regulatory protein